MKKGITLIAIGNNSKSSVYGRMAYNMALSIKYHTDLPIQLIYNNEAIAGLQERHLAFFDVMTKAEAADYYESVFTPSKLKINLYKYLVFDDTIYLDVDGILINDITGVFDNEGDYYTSRVQEATPENMMWADLDMLRKKYDVKTIMSTNSSFQRIRKGKTCEKLFALMVSLFDDKVPDNDLKLIWGSGKQPDELYLNVALGKLGIDALLDPEPLVYKTQSHQPFNEADRARYGISLFGGRTFSHPSLIVQYERELRRVSMEIGQQPEFKIKTLIRNKYVDIK